MQELSRTFEVDVEHSTYICKGLGVSNLSSKLLAIFLLVTKAFSYYIKQTCISRLNTNNHLLVGRMQI